MKPHPMMDDDISTLTKHQPPPLSLSLCVCFASSLSIYNSLLGLLLLLLRCGFRFIDWCLSAGRQSVCLGSVPGQQRPVTRIISSAARPCIHAGAENRLIFIRRL